MMKPFLADALVILKYFTVPSMIWCNIHGLLFIAYHEKLVHYAFWSTLMWTSAQICAQTSFFTAMASFFASKADDRIGATYMAVLWTSKSSIFTPVANLLISFKYVNHGW